MASAVTRIVIDVLYSVCSVDSIVQYSAVHIAEIGSVLVDIPTVDYRAHVYHMTDSIYVIGVWWLNR